MRRQSRWMPCAIGRHWHRRHTATPSSERVSKQSTRLGSRANTNEDAIPTCTKANMSATYGTTSATNSNSSIIPSHHPPPIPLPSPSPYSHVFISHSSRYLLGTCSVSARYLLGICSVSARYLNGSKSREYRTNPQLIPAFSYIHTYSITYAYH